MAEKFLVTVFFPIKPSDQQAFIEDLDVMMDEAMAAPGCDWMKSFHNRDAANEIMLLAQWHTHDLYIKYTTWRQTTDIWKRATTFFDGIPAGKWWLQNSEKNALNLESANA